MLCYINCWNSMRKNFNALYPPSAPPKWVTLTAHKRITSEFLQHHWLEGAPACAWVLHRPAPYAPSSAHTLPFSVPGSTCAAARTAPWWPWHRGWRYCPWTGAPAGRARWSPVPLTRACGWCCQSWLPSPARKCTYLHCERINLTQLYRRTRTRVWRR